MSAFSVALTRFYQAVNSILKPHFW